MAADPHAFISYVREDSQAVDRIEEALEAAGIPVWRDIHSLLPAEDWEDRIRDAIEANALVFIACFSRASEAREQSYQREEILLAVDQLRRRARDRPWFVPVRLDDSRIPKYRVGAGRTLASYQAVDLFGPTHDEAMSRLVDAVRRLMTDLEPARAAEPSVVDLRVPAWLTERDWERLVHQFRNGDCTPLLGPGVSSPPLPTGAQLSRRWDRAYGFRAGDAAALEYVMQFAYAVEGDPVSVKIRFANHVSSFGEPDYSLRTEPHTLLARLPIRTYLTTAYDDFMTRALQRESRQPVSAICPWHGWEPDAPDVLVPNGYEPTSDRPLVYHLHGSVREAASLVLAEQDDMEFQRKLAIDLLAAGSRPLVPASVRAALVRRPLVFLGYDLGQQRFRALLHTLLTSGLQAVRRRHLMVQPPDSAAQEFVAAYANRMNLAVYWGSVAQFCAELDSRLAGG